MTIFEIILAVLWLLLAIAFGLNWRAQLAWHRHYEERLGSTRYTKSPVVTRGDG